MAACVASVLTHMNFLAQPDRNLAQGLWALGCEACLEFSLVLALSKTAEKCLGAGTVVGDLPLTPEWESSRKSE